MPIPEFKDVLKSFRLRASYGLRQFAELVGEIPSNYAALEAGRRGAPKVKEKLRQIAGTLGLPEGSRDWDTFFLSALQSGTLPPDLEHLLERPQVLTLLRTVEEMKLSDDGLVKLINHLKNPPRRRSKTDGSNRRGD